MSDIGPGDLVVCVDASPHLGVHTENISWLVGGKTYTVAGIEISPQTSSLFLDVGCPIVCPPPGDGERLVFGANRFRKLDDGDTERLIEKLNIDLDAKEPAHA